MNEKRSFKIFCKKHTLGTQNKYSLLFDAIDNSNVFNEEVYKAVLVNNGYSCDYFSSDKNYLNRTILKSLNEFHADKTCEIKVKQNLISIEILFNKGLYDECLSLINKTKRVKLISENQYLILEIIKWEKKCLGYSKGILEAIKTNNRIDNYFDKIKDEKIITDLYYKSYFYKNSVGNISKKDLKHHFEEIFKNDVFKNKNNTRNIHINIFFYLIYANFYHVEKDFTKELKYLRKVIHFFNENEIYKLEKPLDFISIYKRIIDINKRQETSTFYDDLNTLRDFDNFINIQYHVAKERIFLHTYQAEIEYLLNFGKAEKAFIIMNKMQEELHKYKYSIEPYYLISMYYLFASIYCSLGNFSGGLKYVNIILNEYKFKQRPKTFIKTEFLNIVIHYELQNYELVKKNIAALKTKYKSKVKLSYLEKQILKNIIAIIKNPNIINECLTFNKLKQLIEQSKKLNSPIEKNYFNYVVLKAK